MNNLLITYGLLEAHAYHTCMHHTLAFNLLDSVCGLLETHASRTCMHRARARRRVQGELSLRLAATDSARVGEAGLVRRELAVDGFRVTGYNRE